MTYPHDDIMHSVKTQEWIFLPVKTQEWIFLPTKAGFDASWVPMQLLMTIKSTCFRISSLSIYTTTASLLLTILRDPYPPSLAKSNPQTAHAFGHWQGHLLRLQLWLMRQGRGRVGRGGALCSAGLWGSVDAPVAPFCTQKRFLFSFIRNKFMTLLHSFAMNRLTQFVHSFIRNKFTGCFVSSEVISPPNAFPASVRVGLLFNQLFCSFHQE
jgi:hypothetical protein